MSTTRTKAKLESPAWLLSGLTGSTAGALSFEDGRITYLAYGPGSLSRKHIRKLGETCGEPNLANKLETREDGVLIFDEALESLELSFPWYTFGGGMTVRTEHDRSFRFSFLRPANTMADPGGGLTAAKHIIEGRAAGKRWRQLVASEDTTAT